MTTNANPIDNFTDQCLVLCQQGLETWFGTPPSTRESPGEAVAESDLSTEQKTLVARLMRVNHAGEVCAQALYQGQAWVTQNDGIKQHLRHAAKEETDHLNWCATRIHALGGHTSYLNPVWYVGSLAIGATAGLIGDSVSLGFVHETEKQVEAHLSAHLARLPQQDAKSRAILSQMKIDEIEHGQAAIDKGGKILPTPIKHLMRLTAKIMTKISYWV